MPTSPFASLSISHQFFQTHTARIAALFLFQIPQNPVPPRHAQSETRLGNLDQENPKNQLPYDEENHERFVPRNRISCNDGPRSLPNVFLDAPVHRRYSILWRRDTRKVILPSQPCLHMATFSRGVSARWDPGAGMFLVTGTKVLGDALFAAVVSVSQPSLSSDSQGISRTRCPRSSSSMGVTPSGTDLAIISPRSFMLIAFVSCKPEPGELRVFKSSIGPPSCHNNARKKLWQSEDPPTTCPRELIPRPRLHGSPDTVPRSKILPC